MPPAGGAKPRGRAKAPVDGAASPRTGSPAGVRGASRGPPALTPRKAEKEKEKAAELLAEQPWQARWRSFKTRTGSTVALLAMFVAILRAGHVFVCLLVFCIQTAMVAEMFTLAAHKNVEKGLPGFRLQQWYFFFCAAFFGYGRMLSPNLLAEVAENAWLPGVIGWSVRHHSFVSYVLYCVGFVGFVMSLKKKKYMYQFGQFAWTHMILFIILLQSTCFIRNIMAGLIWFVLPSSLVIFNDIMAYIFGFFFGRTPLIKLSPKKTWEGFLGALVTTLIAALWFSRYLAQYQWLVCERKDLTIKTWLHCTPENTFRALPATETFAPLPAVVRHAALTLLPEGTTIMPLQLHALSFALFAAIIAPFGGFFASGFKRALRVKDFGDSIPGHGGLTDRMDCQVVMAVFSYIYIDSIVGLGEVTVSGLVEKVARLSDADKLELYNVLATMLGMKRQ